MMGAPPQSLYSIPDGAPVLLGLPVEERINISNTTPPTGITVHGAHVCTELFNRVGPMACPEYALQYLASLYVVTVGRYAPYRDVAKECRDELWRRFQASGLNGGHAAEGYIGKVEKGRTSEHNAMWSAMYSRSRCVNTGSSMPLNNVTGTVSPTGVDDLLQTVRFYERQCAHRLRYDKPPYMTNPDPGTWEHPDGNFQDVCCPFCTDNAECGFALREVRVPSSKTTGMFLPGTNDGVNELPAEVMRHLMCLFVPCESCAHPLSMYDSYTLADFKRLHQISDRLRNMRLSRIQGTLTVLDEKNTGPRTCYWCYKSLSNKRIWTIGCRCNRRLSKKSRFFHRQCIEKVTMAFEATCIVCGHTGCKPIRFEGPKAVASVKKKAARPSS